MDQLSLPAVSGDWGLSSLLDYAAAQVFTLSSLLDYAAAQVVTL